MSDYDQCLKIGDYGYHGTIRDNFDKRFSREEMTYDKKRDSGAWLYLDMLEKYEDAYPFALRAQQDCVWQPDDARAKILILGGRRISDSAMSVDKILEPVDGELATTFRGITVQFR